MVFCVLASDESHGIMWWYVLWYACRASVRWRRMYAFGGRKKMKLEIGFKKKEKMWYYDRCRFETRMRVGFRLPIVINSMQFVLERGIMVDVDLKPE